MTKAFGTARQGGTLRFALDTKLTNLDPTAPITWADFHVLSTMYDTLLEIDHSMQIQPGLVERWEMTSDRSYRMFLRQNVHFHDGTPLTTEQVSWSFRYFGRDGSSVQSSFSPIENVEVVDDQTFIIHLKYPYAPLLSHLASVAGFVLSPKRAVLQGEKGAPSDIFVGTGPFQFVEKTDEGVILKRNEQYWDVDEHGIPLPYVDRIELPSCERASHMLSLLRNGELSFINEVPYPEVPLLADDKEIDYRGIASNSFNGVRLNTERFPFSNKSLRQAFAYAIDREEMLREINLGVGFPSHGPIPPGSWAYDPSFRPHTRNPEKVKELLAEAGYPNGFEFTIYIPAKVMFNMVNFMARHLEPCGIKMNIEVTDLSEMRKALSDRNYEAIFMGATGGTDPDDLIYHLFHSNGSENNTGYGNAEVDRLLEMARVESIQERRVELYRRAQAIIVDDSPFIFTRSGLSMVAKRKNIHQLSPHPDTAIRWKRIWISQNERGIRE